MKKTMMLLLMIIALTVAACGQQPAMQEEAPEADNAPAQQEEPEMEEETPPAPEQEEEAEPEPVIDEGVQELIDTAEERVNSFKFVYVGPPENLPRDTYHVKGSDVAVELAQATDFKISQPFTHVYMDTAEREAVAYCNVRNNVRCPNGTVSHGQVSFDKYYVKTPYQWMKDLQSATYEGRGSQYESRSTATVSFTTKDGVSGEMKVVEYFGLPGKITLDDGTTIEFRDLAINSVSDDKVTPPEV